MAWEQWHSRLAIRQQGFHCGEQHHACTGLRVSPRAEQPYILAMCLLLPPMPHPMSTICAPCTVVREASQGQTSRARAARMHRFMREYRHPARLGHALNARPRQRSLDHVNLGLLIADLCVALRIVAMVHVLAPHRLPQLRRLVIEVGYAVIEFPLLPAGQTPR